MEATESLTSLHTCLQKCLDSDFVFCRSVEFDRSANECLISDEDSYSAPDILPLANSLGVDLYEPICLSSMLNYIALYSAIFIALYSAISNSSTVQ